MVTRLVVDSLRRQRKRWLLALMAFSLSWTIGSKAGEAPSQVGQLLLWAMIWSQTGALQAVPREIRLLPVTGRQLWWAQWWGMVPAIAAIVLAAGVLGAALGAWRDGRGAAGIETVALVSVLVFVLVGALTAIGTARRAVPPDQARSAEGFWRFYRLAGGLLVSAAIAAGAFGVGGGLPLTFAALTPTTMVGLVLATSVVLVGAVRGPGPNAFIDLYTFGPAHYPVGTQTIHAGTRAHPAGPPARPVGSSAILTPRRHVGVVGRVLARVVLFLLRPRPDDSLTGLPKLFWRTWLNRVVPLVVGALMSAVLVGVIGEVASRFAFDWSNALQRLWNAPVGSALGMAAMALIVAHLDAVASLTAASDRADHVSALARHLRALPVKTSRLVGFLIFRRAMGWFSLWAVAIVFHVFLVGAPAELRLDWLLLVIGIDALVYAVLLRGSQFLIGLIVVLFGAVAAVAGTEAVPAVTAAMASVVVTVIGAVALAAAATIHRGSVTSGTRLYRGGSVL